MEKAFEEIGKSVGKPIGELISERVSSPLIGTFGIAWALWNFQFFVVLMSDTSLQRTFKLIHEICYPNWFMSIFNGLIAPVTLTLAYIYLLPLVALPIYKKWKSTQTEIVRVKQEIEGLELLTRDQADILRAKQRELRSQLSLLARENEALNDAATKAEKEVRELTAENDLLKIQSQSRTLPKREDSPFELKPAPKPLKNMSFIPTPRDVDTKSKPNPTNAQVDLMLFLGHSDDSMNTGDLIGNGPGSRIENQFNIEELQGLGMVEELPGEYEPFLRLTSDGRRYLVNEGLAGKELKPRGV